MITKVRFGNSDVLSIGLPFINTIQDLQFLRSGLLEVAELIAADEDAKECISSSSLWFLLQIVGTLNGDIEKMITEEKQNKKMSNVLR